MWSLAPERGQNRGRAGKGGQAAGAPRGGAADRGAKGSAGHRDVSAPRNDDYWFIEPSLDVLITRWMSAGVYYLHREDSSNINSNSFDDNQVGVRASVRF